MIHRLAPVALVATLLAVACSSDGGTPPTAEPDTTTITFGPVDTGTCEFLFGAPAESTGLDDASCRPERICEDTEPFVPPGYDDAVIAALRTRTLVDQPVLLPASPFEDDSLVPADTGGVCAVHPDPDGYTLETHLDAASATEAGGTITHTGACGQCSSLQDLAVYLEIPDLGDRVRSCALGGLGGDLQATLTCIMDLGFSEPCAQIWAFNSDHTGDVCLVPCLANLDEPHHLPDGTLNPCIACDEEKSGPVFKALAGRTRRNSGIPSGICRPGDQVSPILHDAYP